MQRIMMLVAVQAVLIGGLHAAAADEKEPTIARGYTLKLKAGHEAEFETGMKKQIKWYKDNNETWQWHTWQWETGENTGQYVFRSPGHYWKDLDDRSERTARARAHFDEAVRPHLESMLGRIQKVLPAVSRWPEDADIPPMVSVLKFNVHYGMGEEFVHVIGKINEAIGKTDWDVQYAWVAGVSGTEVPTFWLVVARTSWTDMAGPDKPFWTMLEDVLGRAESSALKERLVNCVREEHSALARFRPELSYIPTKR